MNKSILWNGFEIKKGTIETSVGEVPYLFYSPEISKQIINIAIHGETMSKDEWLCFNSKSKFGNLLKESIKHNSPFIAFDLYGHGEWLSDDRGFYPGSMSREQEDKVIKNSSTGISEAILKVLEKDKLEENPISITSYSKGCSIALNLNMDKKPEKVVLLSPMHCKTNIEGENYLLLKGRNDKEVNNKELKELTKSLGEGLKIKEFDSGHEIPESWINDARDFIYG